MQSNKRTVPSIMVVDDELMTLDLIKITLNMAGYDAVDTFSRGEHALEHAQKNSCDLAILDIVMPGWSGIHLLNELKSLRPDMSVIMATGVNEVETAVQCMQQGAFDYIVKPLIKDRFLTSVQHALKFQTLNTDYRRLSQCMLEPAAKRLPQFAPILSQNSRMETIFKYIEAIGPTRHPVLITGETGTGKELVARAIHSVSQASGEFFAVNVAGLDDTVFSDTLFGHVKGAFTGADANRAGIIETVGTGTLLLDEIGDLSAASQVKLLRLLQEGEYYQLGFDRPRRNTARIVASTSRDIEMLLKDGLFRRDLFYRLQTHHIHVPPLRDRKDDIGLLADAFIKQAAEELHKQPFGAPPETIRLLAAYSFPGNVRELKSLMYDAMSVSDKAHYFAKVIRERIGKSIAISGICPAPSADDKDIVSPAQLPTLKEACESLIKEALERSQGNQSMAARILGISRQSLNARIQKGFK